MTGTSTSWGFAEPIPPCSAAWSSSRPVTLCARDPVGLGHPGDVERRQVEPRRALHLLDVREPLEDRVLLVAQDEEGDRDVVGRRRPEAGDRVLRRALAEHADDRPIGLGELHAERGGQPEAEAAAGAEVVAARASRAAAGCAAPACWRATRARRSRRRGRPGPGVLWAIAASSGPISSPALGSGSGSGSARSASPTSATQRARAPARRPPRSRRPSARARPRRGRW